MNNWKDCLVLNNGKEFELGLIWSRTNSLQEIGNEMIKKIGNIEYDYLACVELKGVIFGAAVSALTGKEIRIFRKINKIFYTDQKYTRKFINWKNQNDGIEIEKEQLIKDGKIVFIDDVILTTNTINNVESIIKEANGKLVKIICIKNLSKMNDINGIKIEALL